MAGEEGAPTDLPLEGDQTRHVPIREDQDGGEAAPIDDINPLAPNVSGDNYVMDPAKAETMAYAETDFRTKAVQNRDVERPDPELAERKVEIEEEAKQIDREYGHPPRHLGRRERKELKRRGVENTAELARLLGDEYDDEQRRQGADFDTKDQFEEDLPKIIGAETPVTDRLGFYDPKKRAEFYDQQATRIGEWAGLLHDHPLSDEFKKAHPGVQFQPKGLVRMENEAEALEQEIKHIEDFPGHNTQLAVSTAIKGPGVLSGRIPETQRLLARAADKETDDEYERLTGELMDKAKALDELHNRLVDQEKTQPLRDRLAMTRNLLNDVRREVGLPAEGQGGDAENVDSQD